jgi:hypothetical protein
MSKRAANSAAKEPASPDRNEHTEKAIALASRTGLRRPVRSESAPPKNAETAQVKDSAEAMRPHLLVAESQVLRDERHQEAGGVTVEEQESERDAEHPDETLFVAHIGQMKERTGFWPSQPTLAR